MALENKVSVLTSGWPIEESRELIGGHIKQIDAQSLSDLSTDRFILRWLHLSVEWEYQTVSWFILGMLMGGVEDGGKIKLHRKLIPQICCTIVNVESRNTTPHHIGRLASATAQVATHKTANILDVALFVSRHLLIFLDSLTSVFGAAAFLNQ